MKTLILSTLGLLCVASFGGPPHPQETKIRNIQPLGSDVLKSTEEGLVRAGFENKKTFGIIWGKKVADSELSDYTAELYYSKAVPMGLKTGTTLVKIEIKGRGEAEQVQTVKKIEISDIGIQKEDK